MVNVGKLLQILYIMDRLELEPIYATCMSSVRRSGERLIKE